MLQATSSTDINVKTPTRQSM